MKKLLDGAQLPSNALELHCRCCKQATAAM